MKKITYLKVSLITETLLQEHESIDHINFVTVPKTVSIVIKEVTEKNDSSLLLNEFARRKSQS